MVTPDNFDRSLFELLFRLFELLSDSFFLWLFAFCLRIWLNLIGLGSDHTLRRLCILFEFVTHIFIEII